MVVMVEHGGAGGMIAGTITRKIYEDYFGVPRLEESAAPARTAAAAQAGTPAPPVSGATAD